MKARQFIKERFRNMFSKTEIPAHVEDAIVAQGQKADKVQIQDIYSLGGNLSVATLDGTPCVIRGRWESPSCYIRALRDLEAIMYSTLLEKDPEHVEAVFKPAEVKASTKKKAKVVE